ncbi:uncharacterized protein Z520_12272 [Fonsecaea multimorphosa CBS 102226]|uniref:FAD dependent oxidoreductase domain-containing protein n=1 Tax=Fonsecaea multimorphosa CBS 102226 TaxID=1442371 RepID=A0A0D2I3X7_9EURO|nr:uncharacterized protein Z520_12272 [Fonsecaea multimorphosa CBS 102226]KIX92001.1 hypothetical protein Z520_12272 [Fonsecaea multimorphosa CBS 102226]OAL17359.1 hypothetical protein AYO22_11726 [Fonsecaea multimorphosa]
MSEILVEAEAFDDYGGWVLDSQFELEMGSPYLLAHGNGVPVADATTSIAIDDAGEYHVWVRAKDWVPGHHPGRFTLAVNEIDLDTTFGMNDKDWNWQYSGKIRLRAGRTTLTLHDLTGFCGRCDAIFFSQHQRSPPEGADEAARAWRRRLRGLPDKPVDAGTFDVVVVGGGVVGATAALTAARLGDRVALVQNRPYLGGNASVEAGLRPRGVIGPVVEELIERHSNGDLVAKQLLDAEPRATLFLEHTVYNATTNGRHIDSIDAREARSGREIRLSAPIYIDCSGRAILGRYVGAETLFGQEAQTEYGESLAPPERDNMHHGNTVFFRTKMADSPVSFPDVPWAVEVAKDFSDLRGQLVRPGLDNGPGPQVVTANNAPDPTVRRRMLGPMTHFWEYGNWLDPYSQGENIRDHLLRAIYGTFSNVKTIQPDEYANLALDWVAFVPATGEFCRYKGDHVLTETDIRDHKHFPDAVVQNTGAFCLHYPGDKYDFRLKFWGWDERDGKPYDVPFRCLYSTNVANLMMAGKHISVTHVAGSNTKFMGNGAQHAIATAAAAHLCKKYRTTPRGLYEMHLSELRGITTSITGGKRPDTLRSHL